MDGPMSINPQQNNNLKDLAIKIIGVAIGVTLFYHFWDKILEWVRNILAPWIRNSRFSYLSKYLEHAYISLEDAGTAIRRKAFEHWSYVREKIFSQTVEIEKQGQNYFAKVVSYATDNPYIDKPNIEVLTSKKERIRLDDLPDEVANALHKKGYFKRDITEDRDNEFGALGYSFE